MGFDFQLGRKGKQRQPNSEAQQLGTLHHSSAVTVVCLCLALHSGEGTAGTAPCTQTYTAT